MNCEHESFQNKSKYSLDFKKFSTTNLSQPISTVRRRRKRSSAFCASDRKETLLHALVVPVQRIMMPEVVSSVTGPGKSDSC